MEALPNLQMEGQFTGECRWCEFRKGVCEVGRRPGVARATTVQGWPFTVTHVEVPFEVPLTTVDGVEVMFVGRMDVVGEYLGSGVLISMVAFMFSCFVVFL